MGDNIPRCSGLRDCERAGTFLYLSTGYIVDRWALRQSSEEYGKHNVCARECRWSELACACRFHFDAHRQPARRIAGALSRVSRHAESLSFVAGTRSPLVSRRGFLCWFYL